MAALSSTCAFTALPFIRLLTNNLDQTLSVERLAMWWLVVTVPPVAGLVWIWLYRNNLYPRAAVAMALGAYGVLELAKPMSDALSLSGTTAVGLLTFGLLALVVLVSRWNWVRSLTPALALMSLIAGLSPAFAHTMPDAQPFESEDPWTIDLQESPNIYWFVLDGYGRLDTLRELGVSDVGGFENHLRENGFSIAEEARGNFPLTHLSLASTLSASWVVDQDTTIADQSPFFARMQGANTVVQALRDHGYRFALWPGDRYPGTACSGYEDICLKRSVFGTLEWGLLQMTPLSELVNERRLAATYADRSNPIRATQALLAVRASEPVFAFVHLMSPHPPYNESGPDCESQPDDWKWKDTTRYVMAVNCLNPRVLMAVDLLVKEEPDAIVILQSDHGPAIGLNLFDGTLDDVSQSLIDRSLSVFSAMRLPTGCEQPSDLSLVNTFRVIFGCLSSHDVSLLEHRAWIANHKPGHIRELDEGNASRPLRSEGRW